MSYNYLIKTISTVGYNVKRPRD